MPQPATQNKQITTQLSKREVLLSASQPTDYFEVTVYNDSDRFASFQINLLAAGLAAANTDLPASQSAWYRLTPSVSSKIPAGDCTCFQVEIFECPPINPQFRGKVDLTVEVTSRELQSQYDQQTLRLIIQGSHNEPPTISFAPPMAVKVKEVVTLEGRVKNPTSTTMDVLVSLRGLPREWFPDGIQRKMSLKPQQTTQVTFQCEIPDVMHTRSKLYSLQLEATGRFPQVTAPAQMKILPAGEISFVCDPVEGSIPEILERWQQPAQGRTEFLLQLNNHSNLEPHIAITKQHITPQRQWFWSKPSESDAPEIIADEVFEVGEWEIPLPFERALPWWGWSRLEQWQVTATSPELELPIENSQQILSLRIFPRVPFWLQLLGLFLAITCGLFAWKVFPGGHSGPVNSVQFSPEILSGSADQTFRRWRVDNGALQAETHSPNLDRAVRVVRYNPLDSKQIAIGYENGEIQLLNSATKEQTNFPTDKDDRVFNLVFSQDAHTLFSGHGSGLVRQWDIASQAQILYKIGFAIDGMALVGGVNQTLAVGGRYNRLVLLNTQRPAFTFNVTRAILEPEASPVEDETAEGEAEREQLTDETEDNQSEIEPNNLNTPEDDSDRDQIKPGDSHPTANTDKENSNKNKLNSPQNNSPLSQPDSRFTPGNSTRRKFPLKPKSTLNSPVTEIKYPFPGNSQEFISSLAAAKQRPNLLAVSDTQGHLSIWNTRPCIENPGACSPIEAPWLGHGGSPIRAIAITANACFMASVADDGQVKLWILDGKGMKRSPDGRVLEKVNSPLKAVDIIQTKDAVWVTTGGQDSKVRFNRVKLVDPKPPNDRCPVLEGGL